jgi:hypothetical protein
MDVDPVIRVIKKSARAESLCAWLLSEAESAVGDVHRDFKAETQIGEGGGSPLHSVCLLLVGMKCVCQRCSGDCFYSAAPFLQQYQCHAKPPFFTRSPTACQPPAFPVAAAGMGDHGAR